MMCSSSMLQVGVQEAWRVASTRMKHLPRMWAIERMLPLVWLSKRQAVS